MRHRDLTPRGPSAAQRRHLAATTGTTVVVTPPPPPPPPPPPTPGFSVSVTVQKFTTGVATTLLGNGIPLVQGQLTPAQFDAGMGRLVIAGVEPSAYYERLPGAFNLHPDGSLRSVYVQAQFTNLDPAAPLAGEFRCNEARLASPRGFTDPVTAGWFNSPDAVNYVTTHAGPGIIWPTSATHLCNTGWFFTTRPRSENPTDGSKYAIAIARYDAKFDAGVTSASGGSWDGTAAAGGWDYYDRPYGLWANGARNGDVTLMQMGIAQFLRRRAIYDIPNNYGYAPWVFPGHSLLIAYYLLRDTAARDSGLKTLASTSIAPNPGNFLNYSNLGQATADPRPQGNSLLSVLFAYLSGVTGTSGSTSTPINIANIVTTVQKALNADPAVYPGAPALPSDLSWSTIDSDGNSPPFGPDPRLKETNASSATVHVELAFQTAILFRPLMLLYDMLDWTGNQPTKDLILTRIRTTVENWWAYLRVPEVGSSVGQYGTNFYFSSAQYSTSGGGGRNPASADLNGFVEDIHYWLAARVRATDPAAAATYVARGDELLDGGTRTAVVYTTTLKHWSENTHRRTHAFGYRQQATG